MCLVNPHKSCDNYEPNWGQWKKSGNMCTGFGAGPRCKNCDGKELDHRARDWDKDE